MWKVRRERVTHLDVHRTCYLLFFFFNMFVSLQIRKWYVQDRNIIAQSYFPAWISITILIIQVVFLSAKYGLILSLGMPNNPCYRIIQYHTVSSCEQCVASWESPRRFPMMAQHLCWDEWLSWVCEHSVNMKWTCHNLSWEVMQTKVMFYLIIFALGSLTCSQGRSWSNWPNDCSPDHGWAWLFPEGSG